jgi:hypothetical protein
MRCTTILVLSLIAALGISSLSAWASPLTAVVSGPGNQKIALEPIGNLGVGLVPIDAASIPGDSNLYVGTYLFSTASVRVVDPVTKSISPTPFLTFAGTGVPISGQGLQGITFSPNFNDNTQPGYRKFYTFQAETGPGGANVMFLHPEVASPGTVGVLREWTANSAGTAIDTSIPSRVVFNYGTPGGHMGGGVKFGPDGYLYLSTGDGGGTGDGGRVSGSQAPTDGFTGRDLTGTADDVPYIGNGQDFTNMLGKVIRIDPYTSNADGSPRSTPAGATAKSFGGSTRYFIPGDNPFVGNPQNLYFTPIGPVESQTPQAPLAELYSIGLRNPWKLSFDMNAAPGEAPYLADVGSHVREEIIRVEPGDNYAWPYREGDIASGAANGRPLTAGNVPFLKQTSPGVYAPFDLDPTFSDPAQMPLPMVRLGTQSISGGSFWDRPTQDYLSDGIYGDQWGDTNSVVGGFVYRGSIIPELEGMYVFGGYEFLVRANPSDINNYLPLSTGGRLFYCDPNEAATYKTVREFNFVSGFGINPDGSGNLLSVSQGSDGELYAMFANGDIKRLVGLTPGDFDEDGGVDSDDLNDPILGWAARYGVDLDGRDFLTWQRNFGSSIGSLSNAVSVPEPATMLLLSGVCATALLRRLQDREDQDSLPPHSPHTDTSSRHHRRSRSGPRSSTARHSHRTTG